VLDQRLLLLESLPERFYTMEDFFYWAVFAFFGLQALFLMYKDGMFTGTSQGDASVQTQAFFSFRTSYLVVYSLQMRECLWSARSLICIAMLRVLRFKHTCTHAPAHPAAPSRIDTQAATTMLGASSYTLKVECTFSAVMHAALKHPLVLCPQLVTGCKVPMCMLFTSITATGLRR